MMPWAAAVSKSPSNTQHLIQQQHQQLHHNHQQHLLQQHQQQHHHHLQQQQQQHQNNILNANNHNQNNNSFEPYSGSIGCWSLPESSSSSSRGGWNANDGTLKGDGVADDGTAIWGATKKTGIDWTEKEMLLNPPKPTNSNSSEKRTQKTENSISSINGTEAWGAPAPQQNSSASTIKSTTPTATTNNNLINLRNCNDSQSQPRNDISGKNDDFGNLDNLGWGGDSSLVSSRVKTSTTNDNSSPSINSNNNVWNISGLSKQQPQAKASDWLTGANSSNGNANIRAPTANNIVASSNPGNLQQQKTLSDVVASNTNSNHQFIQSFSGQSKTSPDLNASVIGNNGGNVNNNGGQGANIGLIGGASSSNNNINDLKLSANYSNDLLDSPINRQLSGSVTSNNRQSQFDSAAYANNNSGTSSTNNSSSTANTPSRDLLKQMVHQIHLAVQAGHLNAQILNQPLSTPTLQLVYQLLQQIKTLHQLQHLKANSNSSSTTSSTIDMQINRTTNNISLLHKAITQQQQQASSIGKTDQQQQIGNLGGDKQKQQQQQQNAASNYSYATVSKISTSNNNQKVPSGAANNIINNSNIISDSFNKSSLIDSLKNDSNSDTLRAVQAKFDSNATSNNNFDKTTNQYNASSMQASSSADNVLVNNHTNKPITVSSSDFPSKVQANFMNAASNNQTQQQLMNNANSKSGSNLLWAQSSASSSSSAASATSSSAAWSIFNSSGDYNPTQQSGSGGWPSQLRISSNQVSQQQDHHHQQQQHQHHPFGAFDMASDFNPGKAWLSVDDKDSNSSTSLAPGSNIGSSTGSSNHIVRPSSAAIAPNGTAKHQQQLNGNNLLNNEESSSALFYDWNNDSDLEKSRTTNHHHHFGQANSSSSGGTNASAASSIGNGGLSLQSNPWLFAQQTSSNNPGNGNLIDNLVKNGRNVISNHHQDQSNNINNGGNNNGNKLDQGLVNGVSNKPILGVDAFKSSASANNIIGGGSTHHSAQHRPATSALFDWSNMTSAIQFNNSADEVKQQHQHQTLNSSSSTGLIGSNIGRPGPPPGLLSGNNFAQQQQSTQQSQQVGSNNINSLFDVDNMQSRDASASLWSGAWLD